MYLGSSGSTPSGENNEVPVCALGSISLRNLEGCTVYEGHARFVADKKVAVNGSVLDADRMWRINVAGTARVAEAVGVLNSRARPGPVVQKFIFPSSVSAYGPELVGEVKEDCPLAAHTPSAAGDAVARFPARVPRAWIWIAPTSFAIAARIGMRVTRSA